MAGRETPAPLVWYWCSSNRMTFGVGVRDGMVKKSAPIATKFRGLPLNNLVKWMTKQGGFKLVRLP